MASPRHGSSEHTQQQYENYLNLFQEEPLAIISPDAAPAPLSADNKTNQPVTPFVPFNQQFHLTRWAALLLKADDGCYAEENIMLKAFLAHGGTIETHVSLEELPALPWLKDDKPEFLPATTCLLHAAGLLGKINLLQTLIMHLSPPSQLSRYYNNGLLGYPLPVVTTVRAAALLGTNTEITRWLREYPVPPSQWINCVDWMSRTPLMAIVMQAAISSRTKLPAIDKVIEVLLANKASIQDSGILHYIFYRHRYALFERLLAPEFSAEMKREINERYSFRSCKTSRALTIAFEKNFVFTASQLVTLLALGATYNTQNDHPWPANMAEALVKKILAAGYTAGDLMRPTVISDTFYYVFVYHKREIIAWIERFIHQPDIAAAEKFNLLQNCLQGRKEQIERRSFLCQLLGISRARSGFAGPLYPDRRAESYVAEADAFVAIEKQQRFLAQMKSLSEKAVAVTSVHIASLLPSLESKASAQLAKEGDLQKQLKQWATLILHADDLEYLSKSLMLDAFFAEGGTGCTSVEVAEAKLGETGLFHAACFLAKANLVKILLEYSPSLASAKDGQGRTPMMMVIMKNTLSDSDTFCSNEIIEILLANQASILQSGILHYIFYWRQHDLFKRLLAPAYIDEVKEEINQRHLFREYSGFRALPIALRRGFGFTAEQLVTLLALGAAYNSADNHVWPDNMVFFLIKKIIAEGYTAADLMNREKISDSFYFVLVSYKREIINFIKQELKSPGLSYSAKIALAESCLQGREDKNIDNRSFFCQLLGIKRVSSDASGPYYFPARPAESYEPHANALVEMDKQLQKIQARGPDSPTRSFGNFFHAETAPLAPPAPLSPNTVWRSLFRRR